MFHMFKKVAVIAIGDNSISKDPKQKFIENQYLVHKEACYQIADMIELGWDVAICNGKCLQIGSNLSHFEITGKEEGIFEIPLDVCNAERQGVIGYNMEQNLQAEFARRRLNKDVATVITQVTVNKDDPAFSKSSNPIGSFMDKDEAKKCQTELGWRILEDANRGWRRVVSAPFPRKIVELASVKKLIKAGVVVITIGGGGIPVIEEEPGIYKGVAAVIDKDFASSLLARSLRADLLVISTAVEKVALNFGKPNQKWLDRITLSEAKKFLHEGTHFTQGSMAPKIQAIIWFLEAGGNEALITNIENIGNALKHETGTWFVQDEIIPFPY